MNFMSGVADERVGLAKARAQIDLLKALEVRYACLDCGTFYKQQPPRCTTGPRDSCHQDNVIPIEEYARQELGVN